MRRARLCATLAVCAGLLGCSEDQTALLVEVDSPDLAIPADIDALRFEATTEAGRIAQGTFPIAGAWPHSLAILPGDDDSARVTLRVIGMKDGAEVIRRVERTAFVSGQTREIDVVLTRACYEVSCPADADCVDGTCVGAPVDGGVDAGLPDGGGVDSGAGDAGPDDAGPVDAGRDACVPLGAELCNDADEDCDGEIDEGVLCRGNVVISELATGGPGGAADEYVELYNTTGEDISIAGLGVEYRSSSGTSFATRSTAPVEAVIPAHGFYLFASSAYSRSVTADVAGEWSGNFAGSAGHVRIVDAFDVELDKLGWGAAIDPEGSPQPPLSDDDMQSYERKAVSDSTTATMQSGGRDESLGNAFDSDNNAIDFIHRTAPEPQNTASTAEPPP